MRGEETDAIMSFRSVTFRYGTRVVLEEVNFAIHEGESVCIVGPNGGGKTTLLKLALGLLKPNTGRVEVCGEVPQNVRLKVGYVPQTMAFDSQFPMTVLDVVLMGRLGLAGLGFWRQRDKVEAGQALDEMGIIDLIDRPFAALSGGQRQRVLIARALVSNPRLLLLDEPTAHVDASAETQFRELLGRLHKKMTIITVSHDLGFVSSQVRKVVCVNRTVQVHTTEALTGDVFRNLYTDDLRRVQHGHCPSGGHVHE